MKNSILIILTSILTSILTLILISCGDKKSSNNLHLTGNIKGLQQGKLYIQKIKDTDWVAIETIDIDGDSHFETNLKIDTPKVYFLYLDRGITNSLDNRIEFFAEPGEINIETTLEDYSYKAQITGTKNNLLLEEHKAVLSKFNNDNLDLTAAKFDALKQKNAAKADSLSKKQEVNIIKRYLYTVNFTLNHRDCEVAPYLALKEIPDVNMKYLDTIQKSMTPKVAQSIYGKKLTNLVTERKKNGI